MKNFAYLRPDSPFYSIFQEGMVPIKNIMFPTAVRLEGSDETKAYMLDWSKCTGEQREQIAKLVTEIRGGEPGVFIE